MCSVAVLAGELLREAEKLIAQRIHPMVIADGGCLLSCRLRFYILRLKSCCVFVFCTVAGWRRATEVARAALEAASMDHSSDEAAFRQDLKNIASTTLSSKLLTYEKNLFGTLL